MRQIAALPVCVFLMMAAGVSLGWGETSIRDKYFSQDWAAVPEDAAAAFSTVQAPAVESSDEEPPVHTEHDPVVHMYITRKAYEMYLSQYEGGELSKYIGDAVGRKPPEGHDTVVAGSYEEDSAFQNPFNDIIPELRHFWDCRKGPYAGFFGYDSSVDRAQKYFSGGYGLGGAYDNAWSRNLGKFKGVRGQGALALYKAGDKAKAYWYLGHAAHLLEDLTVPAHALLFPHVTPGSDAYETYMKTQYARWSEFPSAPIERFDSLYDLFLKTGSITNNFDAGYGPGLQGRDGTVDHGRRRAGRFTAQALQEEGDVLMPLAFKRVAALILEFYRQIDQTPPRVSLLYPASTDAASPALSQSMEVLLAASAADDISGVDRNSFRFQYRWRAAGGWSAWRTVTPSGRTVRFEAVPGRLYAVRATAKDAAGNLGTSAVGYLKIETGIPLVLARPPFQARD